MPQFRNKILFANPIAQFESQREEILSAIEVVCTGGPYILGPAVEAFEKEFAAWNSAPHAVGVGSGTDALTLALRACGIGPGDEVITVSFTALATASAIIASGATPVLVDVHPETFTIDPSKIKSALTPKTKAIVPVHLYGLPCDMDAVMTIAKDKSLIVVEDCAQAHGALYKKKKVGTIGDAGAFSFYPTKNLGAIGDAGAVITADSAMAGNIRELRQYGWNDGRIAHNVSSVSRMDPLQAAILSVKLKTLDDATEKRRAIARIYDDAIDWKKFVRPKALPDTAPVYHLYAVTTRDRNSVIKKLAEKNVMAGIHYEFPVHRNPGYLPHLRQPSEGFPVTDKLADTVLSLPIYPELPSQDAKEITNILNGLNYADRADI